MGKHLVLVGGGHAHMVTLAIIIIQAWVLDC
jgi:hypothetical protein